MSDFGETLFNCLSVSRFGSYNKGFYYRKKENILDSCSNFGTQLSLYALAIEFPLIQTDHEKTNQMDEQVQANIMASG